MQLDNKNQEAYVLRGYTYVEELKIDEALADFAEAIKLKVLQLLFKLIHSLMTPMFITDVLSPMNTRKIMIKQSRITTKSYH